MAGTVLASTIKHDVSGAATVFKDGAGTEIGQLCKAWINYTTPTTSSIQASFNHSSITRNGTGDNTLTLTIAMVSAYFCATGMGHRSNGSSNYDPNPVMAASTTNTYNIRTHDYNSDTASDSVWVCVAIHR